MIKFETGKLLKELVTFGIGGPAKQLIQVTTFSELQQAIRFCTENHLRYFILGKGSNTLFHDLGFNGVVILNKIQFIEEANAGEFYVGAGYSFSLLGSQTARQGWTGLEFASGIPGSVGGAVYMNAGAGEGETFHTLVEVSYVDAQGELKIIPKHQLQWGYRTTSFHEEKGAIAAARFQLKKCGTAREKQLSLIQYRTKTQPYSDKSAGCVFRNTSQQSAGRLIEQCGLKGKQIGGAEVSLLHANFIVNKGEASAQDILELASYVQKEVYEKTGHRLEMEIRVIPFE